MKELQLVPTAQICRHLRTIMKGCNSGQTLARKESLKIRPLSLNLISSSSLKNPPTQQKFVSFVVLTCTTSEGRSKNNFKV